MNRTHLRRTVIVFGLLASAASPLSGQAFTGPYAPGQWSTTGIQDGTTAIDFTSSLSLSYHVDLRPVGLPVSFRTAEFSAVASQSSTFTVDWDYSGFHAFFAADATLQLFADTSQGRVVVHLVPQGTPAGGGFAFSGQNASIQIEAGMPFGIIVGGQNFDTDGRLIGTVILSNPRVISEGFAGAFDPSNWTDSGIADGTTALTPSAGPSPTLDYDYDVNLGNPGTGVPEHSATISATVPDDGTIRFDWNYTGFHAFFLADATLLLEIDHNGTTTTIPLVAPVTPVSGNFQFNGSVSDVPVQAGDTLSITVRGSNADSNSRLTGTVSLSNFSLTRHDGFTGTLAPAQWTTTGIAEGATDIGDVGAFSYDVDLTSQGDIVTPRTTEFRTIADADGTASFDWNYAGFHAFFSAGATLQLFADSSTGRQIVDLVGPNQAVSGNFAFSGQAASIQVHAGHPFGIIVGGGNFDTTAVIRGTVRIYNFRAPIAGDLDADGDVDLTDLSTMLSAFGSCDGDPGFVPAADIDNSGCVDLSDLSRLLSNFGS